jgi:hypothetical protein
MPPIPPMPPPGIAGTSFFGCSATMASVITSAPATEAASCRATRTTFAGPIMQDMLRRLLAERLREDFAKEWKGAIPPEFAVQHLVGAFMSVLAWWRDRGAKEPPEEIDRAFRDLALDGLGRLLQRSS